MVYLGIDMHRKSSHVVAVRQDGEKLFSRRVETSPERFWHLFGEFDDQPIQVAFESTFGWGWLADLLDDAGIPAHMAHPLATKAIASARVKNDAVDAHTLAQLLRGDLLPEAWIAPPECREARPPTRMRTSLLRITLASSARSTPSWPSTASPPSPATSSAARAGSCSSGCACQTSPKSAWPPTCA